VLTIAKQVSLSVSHCISFARTLAPSSQRVPCTTRHSSRCSNASSSTKLVASHSIDTLIAKKQTKLATKGFGSDQVWAQLTHHIERSNQQAINSLNALVSSEDFLRGLDQIVSDNEGSAEEADEEEEMEEANEEDMDDAEGMEDMLDGDDDLDEMDKNSNTDEVDEYLDDQDSEEDMKD